MFKFLLFFISLAYSINASAFDKFIDPNPSRKNGFGGHIVVLPNGNVVISSIYADVNATNAGAVYLFNGKTGDLISALYGSHTNDFLILYIDIVGNSNFVITAPIWKNANNKVVGAVIWCDGNKGKSGIISDTNALVGTKAEDKIGYNGIRVLKSGNYVIHSSLWNNGTIIDAGATTWCDGNLGITGYISEENSLIGSSDNDLVGERSMELNNGDYLIISSKWSNGKAKLAGAVTWGDGKKGVTGVVSEINSLVGTIENSLVGSNAAFVLNNGNYFISSSSWKNSKNINVGAITYCREKEPTVGIINEQNSLIGSHKDDSVGQTKPIELKNGNYLIPTPLWMNDTIVKAGAITWGDANTTPKGVISKANSLIGTKPEEYIGKNIIELQNSNYLVNSSGWKDRAIEGRGAITWCDGSKGKTGTIDSSNSFVGFLNDSNSSYQIKFLKNGNFVILNPDWNKNTGAVTLCDANKEITGQINSKNSLIGSTNGDKIGSNFLELENSNFVISSPNWTNGNIQNAGAVTWIDGSVGLTGAIDSTNSLVGTKQNDKVGNTIQILANKNFIVSSPFWSNENKSQAGAVTWCDGTKGLSGSISPKNSLVGSHNNDYVGRNGIAYYNKGTANLKSGDYLVSSPNWNSDSILSVGAVTFCNGTKGTVGIVNEINSLTGSTENDQIGYNGVVELANGNYVVLSQFWDNGNIKDVGAVTLVDGKKGLSGYVSKSNSIIGSSMTDYLGFGAKYNILPLQNGNYILTAPFWDDGNLTDVGAIRLCNGLIPECGVIDATNSLIGNNDFEQIGSDSITILSNSVFIIKNPRFANDPPSITFSDGKSKLFGRICEQNSLMEANPGSKGILELPNKNILLFTPTWANGSNISAGAVTFIDTKIGITGIVSPSNSLVGTSARDSVGSDKTLYSINGCYLIISSLYNNKGLVKAGAATFGDGTIAVSGEINPNNSFIGTDQNSSPLIALLDTINSQFYIRFPFNIAGGDVFVRKFEGTSAVNQEIVAGTEPSISIYPNPARDILNYSVELEVANIVIADIYSTDGTFVKSIQHGLQNPGKQEFSANISGLSSGSYILQIRIGDSKTSKSFEIVK